jgi:hypothetical protein
VIGVSHNRQPRISEKCQPAERYVTKSRQRQRKLPLPATWTTVTPFSYIFLAMTDDPLRVIIRACVTDIPGNKFARSTRLAQDFSEQIRKRPFNNNLKAECHDSEHILPRFDSDDAVRAWFIIDFNITRSLSKEEILALPHEVYLATRQGDSW